MVSSGHATDCPWRIDASGDHRADQTPDDVSLSGRHRREYITTDKHMNNTSEIVHKHAIAAKEELERRRSAQARNIVISCSQMGVRIHVQLRKGKEIVFPYKATVEASEHELVIRDSSGEIVGSFDRSGIVGYWKEDNPVDPKDVAEEFLDDVIAKDKAIQEHLLKERGRAPNRRGPQN
jgi:hypothetical protein